MSRPSQSLLALIALSSLTAGCAAQENWISPQVKTPVLISRVDRIGGHRAADRVETLADVDEEVPDFFTASTEKHGNVQVTRVSSSHSSSILLTAAIERATAKRDDVDVHVDRLHAGSYAFVAGGSVVSQKWVGVRGRAVRAGGAR